MPKTGRICQFWGQNSEMHNSLKQLPVIEVNHPKILKEIIKEYGPVYFRLRNFTLNNDPRNRFNTQLLKISLMSVSRKLLD